ncbi:BppU family phage baseplate upper protein [Staphylococcus caeli]|uniref:BppU family phage baseplate upper protein n=1 Tax=Staphylococcus caeli TaxID=2201815 RepID=UPI003F56F75B
MSMNKIKNIPLETTATYQALSSLNVQFWNQDTHTAILRFQITRNNYPLALSEENVKVFVALESGDSFLVDDNLEYLDELNGIVSYTITDDFMKVATNVVGQVYVTTLDGEETIVQRKFSFDVANDLIASLPAEDKIREIKYFSDMRAEVAQMMEKLNNDFEHMNDYVSQVNQATEDGISRLTALIDTKQKAYNDNHTAKMKELNDKGTQYSTKFDADKKYIDDAQAQFVQSVNGSGVVTTAQTTNWQKAKLTKDDGQNFYDPNLKIDWNNTQQLTDLPIGTRYIVSPLNGPSGATSNNGWLTKYSRGAIQRIEFAPYDSNQLFVKTFYESWSEWKNVGIDPAVVETKLGATEKANTAESNAKSYTDQKISEANEIIYEGSAKGVGAVIKLTKPYDEFNEMKIFARGHGSSECYIRDTDSRNIVMYSFNITDAAADNGDIVETQIVKTDKQTLTFKNVGAYNLPTSTGTVNSSLGLEVYKIVGVRYLANINK